MTATSLNQQMIPFDILSVLQKHDAHKLKIKSFKRNEYVFTPGKYANEVYFIIKGRIKVGTYGEDDKEVIKKVAVTGEVFGEFPLIGQTTRKDYSFAMEDTEAFVLTVQEVWTLISEHKQAFAFILNSLGNRLLDMESRLEAIVFKDSRRRVISFLENLVRRKGQRVGYEMLVRKFFTHQEIANMTATSRQTVTKVLNELRNKNILTFNRRRLLVRDFDALKAAAL